ncbi:MAG: UDP-N-acetylmuramoyl-tripeptide--D-alanyl-D-alanine ligase [Alkalispirochaeta sp.]
MGSSAFPSLEQLPAILSTANVDHVDSVRPTSICIDSRQCRPGALFFALPGEQTDGHRYVAAAAEAGASAAVVREPYTSDGGRWPIPVVVVPDALAALHDLAAWYVTEHLSNRTIRIGVTGSNGKTTTKEMLAAILRDADSCFVSAGNFNSETGLPLSVFETPPDVRYAVYEMAMSRPGEISALARIVRPHHAVITHIGTAHIGYLGSRQAIAVEKKQIAAYFSGNEMLYIPEDDDFREFLSADIVGTVVETGPISQTASLEVAPDDHRVIVRIGARSAKLPIPGRHNGRNALLAIAVAEKLGVDLDSALTSVERTMLPEGRSQRIVLNGLTLIHDAYNANPDSMVASIEMAQEMGATILILGDMHELGAFEKSGHRDVLQAALSSSARLICCIGERFQAAVDDAAVTDRSDRIVAVATATEAGEILRPQLRTDETILLKGSRAVALEQLIDSLSEGGTVRA